MDWKSKLRNPKIQQQIFEVAFPLLGYYFWDWSLFIICLFYLIDFLASQIAFTRRLHFIQRHNSDSVLYTLLTLIVFLIAFTIGSYAIGTVFKDHYILKDLTYIEEFIKFSKDELWYLLPIIIFTYFMQDKLFFYMPRRFINHTSKTYAFKNIISNTIACLLICIGSYLSTQFDIKEIAVILIIICTKLIYDLIFKKRVLKIVD